MTPSAGAWEGAGGRAERVDEGPLPSLFKEEVEDEVLPEDPAVWPPLPPCGLLPLLALLWG